MKLVPLLVPAGNDTEVQFNDGGLFGGDASLTFNKTTKALIVGGDITATGLNLTALGSLPSPVVVGKMIHVTTNNRLYFGRNL